jgi:DNA helicase HerA-like ATPase
MDLLTNQQAYTAMFYFSDALYERTKSEDLAGWLMGLLPILPPGRIG